MLDRDPDREMPYGPTIGKMNETGFVSALESTQDIHENGGLIGRESRQLSAIQTVGRSNKKLPATNQDGVTQFNQQQLSSQMNYPITGVHEEEDFLGGGIADFYQQ